MLKRLTIGLLLLLIALTPLIGCGEDSDTSGLEQRATQAEAKVVELEQQLEDLQNQEVSPITEAKAITPTPIPLPPIPQSWEPAIRKSLGKQLGKEITPVELSNITSLDLAELDISDISPLSNLTKLEFLLLGFNQISDISPIANLTKLDFLNLADNQISDISPISDLTNLTELLLTLNQISNISPIANLTKLEFIGLSDNQISDITPLVEKLELANVEVRLGCLPVWSGYVSDITLSANRDEVLMSLKRC